MMSMVSFTGTLVKSDSTSRDARVPLGVLHRRISVNSSVDFSAYFAGMYGAISLLRSFASLYVGVGHCEMIGLSGFPCLCIFTFPYA